MSYLDDLLEQAKTDPIGAASVMAIDLMRGDEREMKLGYSIGNALISAAEHCRITTIRNLAVVAERVVYSIGDHHSATPRPLVVNLMEGGIVQDTIADRGLGTPEVITLDFDVEGLDQNEALEFAALVAETEKALKDRGRWIDSYYMNIMSRLKTAFDEPFPNWPIDHEEGE